MKIDVETNHYIPTVLSGKIANIYLISSAESQIKYR